MATKKKTAKKRSKAIPQEPAMDPAKGTKDPNWLAWAKEYAPERLEGLHLNWKGAK